MSMDPLREIVFSTRGRYQTWVPIFVLLEMIYMIPWLVEMHLVLYQP